MNKKIIGAIATMAVVLPMIAAAQSGVTGAVPPPNVRWTFTDLIRVLNTMVTWIFTVFLILSVIMIIWAAFQYLLSGGSEEKVQSASRLLIYAAVAIAVALLAIAVRFIVGDLLQVAVPA